MGGTKQVAWYSKGATLNVMIFTTASFVKLDSKHCRAFATAVESRQSENP